MGPEFGMWGRWYSEGLMWFGIMGFHGEAPRRAAAVAVMVRGPEQCAAARGRTERERRLDRSKAGTASTDLSLLNVW